MTLNKHEKLIIQTLHRERRPMSISEIARENNISWVTANRWVKTLKRLQYLKFFSRDITPEQAVRNRLKRLGKLRKLYEINYDKAKE